MSSAASQPPPYLLAEQGDNASPYTATIPGSIEVEPSASTATFDGTGASGPFLACLTFRAQSGELLSRVFPQTQIAAGDVAQVSYAPFPGGLASTGGGSNIDTTDGAVDVNPTTQLFVADGIKLTNPAPGEARVAVDLTSPDGSVTITPNGPGLPIGLQAVAGSFALISDQLLAAPAQKIDFTAIPQTFAHLQLVCQLRSTHASIFAVAAVTFNNLTGGLHEYRFVDSTGFTDFNTTGETLADCVGSLADAQHYGYSTVSILDYSTSRQDHGAFCYSMALGQAINTGTWRATVRAMQLCSNVSYAINQITFDAQAGNTFIAGSRVTLYGLVG